MDRRHNPNELGDRVRPEAGRDHGDTHLVLRKRGFTSIAASLVVALGIAIALGSAGLLLAPAAEAATVAVRCPADNLQTAIDNAPPASIIVISGTCSGNFDVPKNLTLVGVPATLDGQNSGTVLSVEAGVSATLIHLTVQHGNAQPSAGGILNGGTVTLDSSTVSENTAGAGGGIFNDGTVVLNSSTVSGNGAPNGGGILNNDGTVVLNSSTVSGNEATNGGGIFAFLGTVTLNFSSVSGNVADTAGGGIFNNGTLTLNSSTVSGNRAPTGGGIDNFFAAATLRSSRVSGNVATSGGGIYNFDGTIILQSSSVFDNEPNNCAPPNSVPGCSG